jgi:hypothetical protein
MYILFQKHAVRYLELNIQGQVIKIMFQLRYMSLYREVKEINFSKSHSRSERSYPYSFSNCALNIHSFSKTCKIIFVIIYSTAGH